MMKNANKIAKQSLDLQKGVFAGWYGAMSILQDQAASAVDMVLDQTSWIPDEGRQIISSWLSTCKNERDRYRVYMEESFSGLEKCLVPELKAAPAKPQKPTVEAKKAAPPKPSKPAAEEIRAAPAQETKKAAQ
jgi:hypothetical protein